MGHIIKIIFFQYTDANVCAAIVRPMKHKQMKKNSPIKLEKCLFILNVARLMAFKNSHWRISILYFYFTWSWGHRKSIFQLGGGGQDSTPFWMKRERECINVCFGEWKDLLCAVQCSCATSWTAQIQVKLKGPLDTVQECFQWSPELQSVTCICLHRSWCSWHNILSFPILFKLGLWCNHVDIWPTLKEHIKCSLEYH